MDLLLSTPVYVSWWLKKVELENQPCAWGEHCIPPTRCCHNFAIRSSPISSSTIFTRLTLLGLLLFNTNNNNNQSNMKLSILLIGSASIAIVSAEDTPAPTTTESPSLPPITPFPTEGPPVSYIWCCAFALHRTLASVYYTLFDWSTSTWHIDH